MTTMLQARDNIVSLIETDVKPLLAGRNLYYANTVAVDLGLETELFLRVEIEFEDAAQATVELNPMRRTFGAVYFTLFYREGSGSRVALTTFDSIINVVKNRVSGSVIFKTPVPTRTDARKGWVSQQLRAPFYFDSRH